ncbi:LamG-like jellyroll fold domain-containing protein [Catellatospora sp. IY07-71]|uniref:LamG-like jellyroll fold domain-containing protein n=1 Tax=Catellatospora sp. IY07-71 TaxID=2728827 RepID=UPI001BB41BA5|nr:LamG-like jellyroll fold domain-containing protein [Catellatospora sp. IY07-71]
MSVPAAAAAAAPAPQLSPELRASQLAKETGKPVTVAEELTENRHVSANPDGTFTVKMHGGPARFRNSQGDWVDVDLNLYKRPDGAIAPKAHPRGLVLAGASEEGSHDLARFVSGGHEIAVGWTGALPEPTLSGTKATYVDVLPGVDLVVEVTRVGFEYFVVVNSRAAAARVAKLELPWRADGLTPVHAKDGSVDLRDSAGKRIAWIPVPRMWDARRSPASGDPSVDAPVAVTLDRSAAAKAASATGQLMRVVPDAKFLSDPKTVYPVTIDPMVTDYTEFDTFTQNSYTSDTSGMTELKLGYVVDQGKSYYARSHMSFYGMASYRGVNVLSATLYLYNFHSYSCRPSTWQAWRTDYVGSSVRWTNPPTRRNLNDYTDLTKGYSSSCGDGWVTQNVTETFQTTANSTSNTANIEIAAKSLSSQDSWKKFHSAEGTNAPYVSLNYNRPPTAPTNLFVGNKACATGASRPTIASTVTPIQLKANVSDPDYVNEAVNLNARFYVAELGTPLPTTPTVTSPTVTQPKNGAAQTATANLPTTFVLQEFRVYYFQVRGWDQEHEGAWSAICEFYVDNGSPAKEPVVEALDTVGGVKVYPENGVGGGPGVSSRFRFSANGQGNITKYRYKYSFKNVATNWVEVPAPTLSAPVEVVLAPPFNEGEGGTTLADLNTGGQWAITVEMADNSVPPRWSTKQKLYLTQVGSAPAAVANWKFNEAAGATTLTDQTGAFNAAAFNLTKSTDNHGDMNSSWEFNGTSSYAEPDSTVLDSSRSHSISVWVRLGAKDDNRGIVAKTSAVYAPLNLRYECGPLVNSACSIDKWALRLASDESGSTVWVAKSTTAPQIGVWTHLAGVFDATLGTASLYVNGVLQETLTGVKPFNAVNSPRLLLGRAGSSWWKGGLDDVALWQRALDAREVGALAVAERANWDLDMSLMDAGAKPITNPPFDLQGYVWDGSSDSPLGIGTPTSDDALWWTGVGHATTSGGTTYEDPGVAQINVDAGIGQIQSFGTDRPVLRTDQSYSVSLWARLDDLTADRIVFAQRGVHESGIQIGFQQSTGKWRATVTDEDLTTSPQTSVTSSASAVAGAWTHLVAVFDGHSKQLRLYVDNGTPNTAAVSYVPMAATGVVKLGNTYQHDAVGSFWVGGIDEVRVFQGVLTADMIGRLNRTPDGVL